MPMNGLYESTTRCGCYLREQSRSGTRKAEQSALNNAMNSASNGICENSGIGVRSVSNGQRCSLCRLAGTCLESEDS